MRCLPDIIYTERHGIPLALDLFLPDGPASGTVMHAHGGGFFKGGRKGERTTRFAERLTAEGLAMAAVSYRLGTPPQSLSEETRLAVKTNKHRSKLGGVKLADRLMGSAFEAARQDLDAAQSYLTFHRQAHDIKTEKTAVLGISAGGIAGLAAAHPAENLKTNCRPDAVVALGSALVHPWALDLNGPPCLMIHSHFDRVVSPENARLADQAAKDANAPLAVFICDRKGHNAPVQALLDDDAPDGTPYWSLMMQLFCRAGLFNPSPAGV